MAGATPNRGFPLNQTMMLQLRLGAGFSCCLDDMRSANADLDTPTFNMTLALAENHTPPAPAQQRAVSAADSLLRAIQWQLVLTLVLALSSLFVFGLHAGMSAVLGGAVSIAAAWVFRWLVGRSRSLQLMDTLVSMLKAELAKVGVIIVGLLLCFVLYKDVVALALVGVFIVTTLMFAGAAFLMPTHGPGYKK